MESNNLKKAFLMEDFNKGLMLAGLVASSTQQEINDLRALNNYEKDLLILISKNNGSKLKLIDAPKFR